jgi:hypothetical protein
MEEQPDPGDFFASIQDKQGLLGIFMERSKNLTGGFSQRYYRLYLFPGCADTIFLTFNLTLTVFSIQRRELYLFTRR